MLCNTFKTFCILSKIFIFYSNNERKFQQTLASTPASTSCHFLKNWRKNPEVCSEAFFKDVLIFDSHKDFDPIKKRRTLDTEKHFPGSARER